MSSTPAGFEASKTKASLIASTRSSHQAKSFAMPLSDFKMGGEEEGRFRRRASLAERREAMWTTPVRISLIERTE